MWQFSGVPAIALVNEDGACQILGMCGDHLREVASGRIRKFREVDGIQGEGEIYYALTDVIDEQARQFERNRMRTINEVETMLERLDNLTDLDDQQEGIREALLWVVKSREDDALLSYIEDTTPTTDEPAINGAVVDTEGANRD